MIPQFLIQKIAFCWPCEFKNRCFTQGTCTNPWLCVHLYSGETQRVDLIKISSFSSQQKNSHPLKAN